MNAGPGGGFRRFAAIAIVLAAVAAIAPKPWYGTDRGTYETVGRELVIPDCSELHCFRVLVAWPLESLPGPSLLKWKAYAVLANAGAAMAVGSLCLVLGLSSQASIYATWLSALGFGSFYTVFDCYTSDPLMFLLGPLLTAELLRGRRGRSTVLGSIGVLAKEFAAAPLWIYTLWTALRRNWDVALRSLLAASTVTMVWMALHVWLVVSHNYSYGGSASADLAGGGFLVRWYSLVGLRGAVMAVFVEFGALYVLFPFGLLRASRELRLLVVAAIPAAAALAYVQQPDRALWNFHFLVIPIAVLALENLPSWCVWLFIALFALANLRVGAQLPWVPPSLISLALSTLVAGVAAAVTMFKRPPALVTTLA
jgi:hypothetical protein